MSPHHWARGEVPYLHRMQLPVGMATSVKNANQRHTSDQWVQWLTHPWWYTLSIHCRVATLVQDSPSPENLDIPLPPDIT